MTLLENLAAGRIRKKGLPPDASPDGLWHLFAHSVFGIHHYMGETATNWQKQGVVKRHAMRAFVFAHGAEFHLY